MTELIESLYYNTKIFVVNVIMTTEKNWYLLFIWRLDMTRIEQKYTEIHKCILNLRHACMDQNQMPYSLHCVTQYNSAIQRNASKLD